LSHPQRKWCTSSQQDHQSTSLWCRNFFKGLLPDESDLPTASDAFDPNPNKLLKELGYDFSKPPSPMHVIEAKLYGPNDKQKMVQK